MDWAADETEASDLGDERLNRRYTIVLDQLSSNPSASIPTALGGWSEINAAYRFFKNPNVTVEDLLEPHRERTIERMREQKVVLLVQDTTELDYTKKSKKIKGLGALNRGNRYGAHLHPTVAFTPDKLCLGVTSARMLIRDAGTLGSGHTKIRTQKAIEEKESYRWLQGYQEACDIAKLTPETKIVMVADREADIYDIFEEASGVEEGKAEWLIRSNHNRALVSNESRKKGNSRDYLRETVESKKPLGNVEFELPARAGRAARTVCLTVYASSETLRPPSRKVGRKLTAQKVSAIIAREEKPPKDQDPVEWVLISSMPVRSFDRAAELIRWYAARWGIEVFFRVLKTGCQIEELQFRDFEHLAPCIAAYMIITWRILFLTFLGRECPDLSCEVVFDEAEWKAAYIVSTRTLPPKKPPHLSEIINMIAKFGGYLARKNDPPPGPRVIWIGLQRTRDFALGQIALGYAQSS